LGIAVRLNHKQAITSHTGKTTSIDIQEAKFCVISLPMIELRSVTVRAAQTA